jgi:ATP-dependent Clp protease ATP-binding subunit ClpC
VESAILLILGLLIGWVFARWQLSKGIGTGASPQSHSAAAPNEPPLASRLHQINETLEPFARDAAHTNELAENADFRKAAALLADPKIPLESVLDYAFGQNWALSCAAFVALKERPDGRTAASRVPPRFNSLSVWQMTFALKFLASVEPKLPAGAPLIGYRDWWSENTLLRHVLADHFAALGDDDPADPGADVMALPDATRSQIKDLLRDVHHPLAARLAEKLVPDAPSFEQGAGSSHRSSSAFLESLGRFWDKDEDKNAGIHLEAPSWKDALDAAERLVNGGSARVLLVSGEPYVGKTTFLRLLASRLKSKDWRVFEASGADLQAGQMYIGQLEGRIREALTALDVRNDIIWYVPDLLALAMSGTHQSQSASILDQILPALAAGCVLMWTEATPAATARLQQVRPSLRRYLEIVRMEEMPEEEALALAKDFADRLGTTLGKTADPSFAATAIDVAESYLSAMHLPGSALSLMKLSALRTEKAAAKRLNGDHILETLSQLTGLPLSILDGAERLSLENVRDFFSSRVIGQPEAVASVVERIAMLKSGLNDPGKPIAVFLFAGPTGTGKTELAKAVAEYLFGSVDRMIRLDMSEYQTHESCAKILGGVGLPTDAETLISRIRKQPFSVVLLDEFEKAHPQIWDLFLQVFDEGRLSDASGQMADFRHCLIILTSNLGATSHRDSGLGFTPVPASFTDEQIERAIAQTFRPEFQNRLDKIIVFKPLTRELMRAILSKELARIFERRGLKDRAWAVEWDATALEFLLEKGFSPEMGARPLKRAIDHFVVAPLAETIVERRFPEGDQFVFIRRDGNALRADFIDPEGEGETNLVTPAVPGARIGAPPNLFEMMRVPSGRSEEITALASAHEPIVERLASPEWAEFKTELTREINAPGFWSRPDRSETLMRLELMDRIEVAAETATSLQGRLARQSGTRGKNIRDLIARLAMQIHLVSEGMKDLDEKAPAEAALIVEPAFVTDPEDNDAARAWREEIAQMYRAWAQNRNMNTTEIDGIAGVTGPALLVAGFGAHRTLARETGLHILERSDSAGSAARTTAQVLLAPLPLGTASKAELRQALAAAFAQARRGTNIVRRYRRAPTPLVRNGDGTLRSGKVEDVLRGNFDLFGHEPART